MSKAKNNIESIKKMVKDSASSLYSKDDVISLLERIDKNEVPNSSDKVKMNREWLIDHLEAAKLNIIDKFDDISSDDVIDFDTIDIGIDGREIYFDSTEIQVNLDTFIDKVEEEFENLIDKIYKK